MSKDTEKKKLKLILPDDDANIKFKNYDGFLDAIMEETDIEEEDLNLGTITYKGTNFSGEIKNEEDYQKMMADNPKRVKFDYGLQKIFKEFTAKKELNKFFLVMMNLKKKSYENEQKLINEIVKTKKESLPEIEEIDMPFKETGNPEKNHGISCTECKKTIKGIRYKCSLCDIIGKPYDLCQSCKANFNKKKINHPHNAFIEIFDSDKYSRQYERIQEGGEDEGEGEAERNEEDNNAGNVRNIREEEEEEKDNNDSGDNEYKLELYNDIFEMDNQENKECYIDIETNYGDENNYQEKKIYCKKVNDGKHRTKSKKEIPDNVEFNLERTDKDNLTLTFDYSERFLSPGQYSSEYDLFYKEENGNKHSFKKYFVINLEIQ